MELYATDSFDVEPVGPWSIMSYGFTQPTIYEKYKYGHWINQSQIGELTQNGTYSLDQSIYSDTSNIVAYRINLPNSKEYFMIEYRENIGSNFEANLSSSGLIFYRIDPENPEQGKEIYVFRKGAYFDSNTFYYGDLNEAAYGGTEGKDKFNEFYLSDFTSDLGININNIRKVNGKIYFDYYNESEDKLEKVSNVRLSKNNVTEVGLTWDMPSTKFEYFKIYRNGQLLGTSKSNSYTDITANSEESTYDYQVTTYNTLLGESEKSNPYPIIRDKSFTKGGVHFYYCGYTNGLIQYFNNNIGEIAEYEQSNVKGFLKKDFSCNYGSYIFSDNNNFTDADDISLDLTNEDIEECEIYTITQDKIIKGHPETSDIKCSEVEPLQINSVNFNKSSPQCLGQNIEISVNSIGGAGQVRYRILANTEFCPQVIQNYSKSSSVNWIPNMILDYSIIVYARDEWGNVAKKILPEPYVIRDNYLDIDKITIDHGSSIDLGESVNISIAAAGGSGNLNYSVSATNKDSTELLLDQSQSNLINWTPKSGGVWKIFVTVTDTEGNQVQKEIELAVNDINKNQTTIYYKGYSTPYIHYKIGNGSWTSVPGVLMTQTSEMQGFTHKIIIDLGTSNIMTACFNNGSGSWDSKNGANY